MKAALGFALAAIAVLVLAVFALRDDTPVPVARVDAPPAPVVTPQPDPLPPPAAVVETPPPPVPSPALPAAPEVIDDEAFMEVINQFGFQRLEGAWREWAMTRGYPITDPSGVQLYDQPYEQYDDETLRGLADNGDMWASQILADRIATTNPAEATELYRRAATRGSVYAMHEMAALYQRISDKRREVDFKTSDLALEQVYAMRDAPVAPEVAGFAWTVVAEMAGSEPMFGSLASSQLQQRMNDDQIAEACSMAQELYGDLRSQRSSLGLGDFDRSPPPLVYTDPTRKPPCGDQPGRPGLDLTGCRELVVDQPGDAGAASVWVCDDAR